MSSLARARVRIARVITGSLTVVALLSGCATHDEGASRPEHSHPSAPGSPAGGTVQTGSSPSSSSGTSPAPSCAVRGYSPRTRLTLLHARPVVVYAIRKSLPPAGSTDDPNARAAMDEPVRIGLRSTRGPEPVAGDADVVLRSAGGPVRRGAIRDHVRYPVHLRNRSSGNRSYLVYRGALAMSGRWTMTACGAPYNDGTRVEVLAGTYETVSRIRAPRVAVCGRMPAHATALARHAARRACA